PSLAALVKEGEISATTLISPSSGRKTIKTDEKGVPTDPGDYEYIVLPATAPGDLIRAYEKPEINQNEGTNVLFADGSIRWMDMKDFQTLIKVTMLWLAKQK
ncbi:MAG TPA: H-X9-DG-CTERM domain-containing protein, partial [Phycisphaerae bacterium]|nr:H-X9-DG-CTERM domain-containing protein [Phycisphaerae bacterium]